jgi:hypothetical protein
MDIVKMIRRIRMHNETLKSSLLCDKKRRRLLKHTKAYTVDLNTDSDNHQIYEKPKVAELGHGFCLKNEQLISENIFKRIMEKHPDCMCHVINKPKKRHYRVAYSTDPH